MADVSKVSGLEVFMFASDDGEVVMLNMEYVRSIRIKGEKVRILFNDGESEDFFVHQNDIQHLKGELYSMYKTSKMYKVS